MHVEPDLTMGLGAVSASRLEQADRPVVAQAAGRRCAHPRCDTALSRYNPDDRCTVHGGWSDRTVKRPGRQVKAAEATAAVRGTDCNNGRAG